MFKKKVKRRIEKISLKEINSRLESLEKKRIESIAMLKSLKSARSKLVDQGRNADDLEKRSLAFKIRDLDSRILQNQRLLDQVELGEAALRKVRDVIEGESSKITFSKAIDGIDIDEITELATEASLSDEELLGKLSGIANLKITSESFVKSTVSDYSDIWGPADTDLNLNRKSEEISKNSTISDKSPITKSTSKTEIDDSKNLEGTDNKEQ